MAKSKRWLLYCTVFSAVLCAAVALICLCVASSLVDRGCSGGQFQRAAVSADSLKCSVIGRNMLQQGGSAVDGAIAALLCTSVVNPQSMGLGGGSIITIRDKTGKVKVYNSRETVPQSFSANLLNRCSTAGPLTSGPDWIGVPGELRGYEAIHKEYGKLPWAKLFEPSIKLARDGLPMPAFLRKLLKYPIIKTQVEGSSLCEILCNKNKTVLSKNVTIKFPKLADTMETIAQQGPDVFYTGKIGLDLIQDIRAAGGTLKMEDLKTYKVRVDDAWEVPLGNTKMYIPPPPAGGALLAFILSLMNGYLLTPNSLDGNQKIQTYHRYIEAVKFANGQKQSICDPIFSDKKSAAHLMNSSFINHIREMISPNFTHPKSYYNIKPSSDHFGTTHVSVLDEDGLAVSATSTINSIFGGAIYSQKTGIILNNELADFCGRADSVKAGEQPPSSMTPVILQSKSGGLILIGGSGGSMITTAVAMSLINRLWLGMSLKDAIAAPIAFVDSKNNVNFEDHFDKVVIDGLRALGHSVGDWKYYFNVVNAVEKESGCITAASDRRKMGTEAGY
ncbi:glutathione hydrolase 5 proenzyme [Thalassophryne amazonica]|uniref:glutathione hydrolase 5 proenzyme n=1 Tax=Thalassophryne amazonica TaxID=390379 RepID=UPI001470C339|nr:glutathione hydrolase 5 proenzyme [Thalassophryne amazonica]